MKNKYFIHLLKIIWGLIIVLLLFQKISFAEVSGLLKSIKINFFFLGLIIIYMSWLINSYKWKIILKTLSIEIETKKLLFLNFISLFYATILPGGQITGEAIKFYKIKTPNVEKKYILGSIIMDRIIGLVSIIILGFVSILLTKTEIKFIENLIILFTILIVFSFLFFLPLNTKLHYYLNQFFIRPNMKNWINGLFMFKNKYKSLSLSFLYGLIFQILSTFSLLLFSLSLGIKISFIDLLWINALTSILLVLPISLAGLGIREASFVYFLSLFSVPNHQALSFALLTTFTTFIIGFSGGIYEIKSLLSKR